jgi:hypothetical protein
MGNDKQFNHAFKYCLNEQVRALCNIFIYYFFHHFSAICKVYWGDNHVGMCNQVGGAW